MADHMPKEVENRIRALPGNDTCCDCNQPNPQWASVSYGCLMCLECSGQHRSLGVHLSFVRSIAMDSWNDRQIQAMERSGGNKKLVEFFAARGITKEMKIATKYNTKQAAYYRERLTRWLDGKTEPPPDPGRFDPATGVSEAQGAEPLPGESTDDYNARQARLREAARERLRAKFGDAGIGGGGMSGIGCDPGPSNDGIGGLLGGVGSFIKSNVIDNENVRGVARAGLGAAGGAINSIRTSVSEGQAFSDLRRNISGEEDTMLRKGLGAVGGLIGRVSGGGPGGSASFSGGAGGYQGDFQSSSNKLSQDDEEFFRSIGQKSTGRSASANLESNTSNGSMTKSAPQRSKSAFDDDDWGGTIQADPAPQDSKDIMRRSSCPGSLGAVGSTNGSKPQETPSPSKTAQAAPPVERTPPPVSAPKPKPKAKAKLDEPDDFFASFGV